jgi:hypothetical protein
MPLDSSIKINHILANVTRLLQGRSRTVVFVTLANGSYSYTTQNVIMRPQTRIDPEIPNVSGGKPGIPFDMLLLAPPTTSFTGVVMVADTTTPTVQAVSIASKYEVIEALPVGIVPGGTHIRALLRRLR